MMFYRWFVPRSWWEEERKMSKQWEEWYWKAERQKDDLLDYIEKLERKEAQD